MACADLAVFAESGMGRLGSGPSLRLAGGGDLMPRLQSGGSIMGWFESLCWTVAILAPVIAAVLLAVALFA
jgi:hypothetical protein